MIETRQIARVGGVEASEHTQGVKGVKLEGPTWVTFIPLGDIRSAAQALQEFMDHVVSRVPSPGAQEGKE